MHVLHVPASHQSVLCAAPAGLAFWVDMNRDPSTDCVVLIGSHGRTHILFDAHPNEVNDRANWDGNAYRVGSCVIVCDAPARQCPQEFLAAFTMRGRLADPGRAFHERFTRLSGRRPMHLAGVLAAQGERDSRALMLNVTGRFCPVAVKVMVPYALASDWRNWRKDK